MAIEVYSDSNIQIKNPSPDYGFQIAELVKNSPPLDLNSTYHYFIQSHYFAETCAIAVNQADKVIGYVSGFNDPRNSKTLFIWQVAISKEARGSGLASKLIHFILHKHPHVQFIETTITKDNTASISLFKKCLDLSRNGSSVILVFNSLLTLLNSDIDAVLSFVIVVSINCT